MEPIPTPTNESQPKSVFDYSKYNQPDVAEPAKADEPAESVFDFTEHQDGQKTFAESVQAIDEQNNATKVFDPSDANIESGNSILRDLTPAEINEKALNDQHAEQLTTSTGKFLGSNIVNRLFHRG
ncbi:MAG: hypothetical protein JWM07_376 [Candidatus Saccharibacteria bacterium]|nr:hypothetical protein [Candidatus Saccharibacteria bacterium]